MITHRLPITFSLIILLSSCVVGPKYTKPAVPSTSSLTSKTMLSPTVSTQTPLGHAQHFAIDKTIPAQWWSLFHSKALDGLVKESFQRNPNITAARASLHGALENVYAQQGALFPFVGFSFVPSKQQTAKLLTSVLASNQYDYALYTGQLYVSYTPDVFGGTGKQIASLAAQADIQHLQLEATYLTLASNVVNAAIQEAALREQIHTTQVMIETQTKITHMIREQHNLGDVSQADIALQEAALAATKATLPPLEKQLAIQRDLLNALTGHFPDENHEYVVTLHALTLPTKLPMLLPSTLLEHRPDIRAAETQMRSANALIGVAISNRLPNISIGFTNAGTAATSLSTLFNPNTTFWAIAGIITQPIFDGGTLLHKQRFAEAMYTQAAAQYQATVINAFQNVADTLNAIRFDAVALQTAKEAELAAQKSLSISRQQLAVGDTTMLMLLTNEQRYQQVKLNLIQAEMARLTDTVALFQALGGNWWTNHDEKIKDNAPT